MSKQTLQERFGFQDPELTSPKHDAIMFWLDSTIDRWLSMLLLPKIKWGGFYDLKAERSIFLKEDEIPLELPFPHCRNLKKVWECPIQNNRGFITGFVDMRIVYQVPLLGIAIDGNHIIEWHEAIYPAYFEIKPSIPSLGELIRQIRLYQATVEYGMVSSWFVVSPDDRFRDQLEAQGIGFLKCP